MSDAQMTPITETALYLYAMGKHAASAGLEDAHAAYQLAKVKATDTLLALAKAYPDLQALAKADTEIRALAVQNAKANGSKATTTKGLLRDRKHGGCCASYLTGMDQIRSAAGKLGWEAVMQAATIGALYAKANPKVKGANLRNEAKVDSLPKGKADDEAPATPVQAKVDDLMVALAKVDEATALSILEKALTAAAKAAAKAAREKDAA